MNKLNVYLALLIVSGTAVAGTATEQEKAMAASAALGKALKTELVGAMQSGGPLAAIEVCHSRAPAIAAAVSAEQGVQVSRVSSRNRNPDNAPEAWQTEVLESFQERIEEGEDVAGLIWQETVEAAEGKEYRFMKAIPTDGVCLACHGKAIDPAVAEKLAALYPNDQATGFGQGDLRGAFVVTRRLEGK